MAPRKAYLELDAQPATITPYTPIEVTAMMYSSEASILASTSLGMNGTTAQAASAGAIDRIGPTRNKVLFALAGSTISLSISLMPSAIGCSRPLGPTRFGPIRICI